MDKKQLAIGTAYFGTKTDKSLSFLLLDYFTGKGGSLIDTANSYAAWEKNGVGGDSEKVIGEWLTLRNNRESIKIISKVGFGYGSIPHGLDKHVIIDQCNVSLDRLKTNYIDYYLAHVDDNSKKLEVTIETFQRLISDRKIRNWGLSNYSSNRLIEVLELCKKNNWAKPRVIQNHFSIIKTKDNKTFSQMLWEPLTEEILNICNQEEIIPMAHSSLLWGAYSRDDKPLWGSFNSKQNRDEIQNIRNKCSKGKKTPNQYVLSYIINHKPSIVPVIGTSNIEQLEENLGVLK